MYHDLEPEGGTSGTAPYAISAAAFERQLDTLKNEDYRVIGFSELFRIMEGREPRTGREVIVTFDDGYESFASIALPALVARHMTATVFVVAGEIGGHNRWDALHPSAPRRRLMDDRMIRQAIDAGMSVGSHGWLHRDLTVCSAGDAEVEMSRSRDVLRERFSADVDVFCYPFGAHAPSHGRCLERAGYRGAVTITSSERRVTSNRYAMRRVYVHASDGERRFRMKLSSLYLRYRGLRDARAVAETPV
jgi:peptidoglycan/xylan/chitin deacetylase (PgdA/CDA1 family)